MLCWIQAPSGDGNSCILIKNGFCSTSDQCECDDAYHGNYCEIPCEEGTYGKNCSNLWACVNGIRGKNKTCHCFNGFTGEGCDTPCPHGTFGRNCEENCSCVHGDCNPATGHCDCHPGFEGPECDVACKGHTYGKYCKQKCLCSKFAFCEPENGTCIAIDGGRACPRRLNGKYCEYKCKCSFFWCDEKEKNPDCLKEQLMKINFMIGSIVVGGIIFILVGCTTLICLLKGNRMHKRFLSKWRENKFNVIVKIF